MCYNIIMDRPSVTYGPEGIFLPWGYVMADKIYKTHKQQLKILRSRGMEIAKGNIGSRTMRVLERENYYSVINGYKEPFIVPNSTSETYLTGTQFGELYAVFNFDRNIRLIYLKYILKVEHQIKTVIAHEFSKLYGHDNYLKLDSFDTRNIKQVLETIGRIQNALSNQMGKSQEVTHYMSTYGYVPLWVLVNILTLGEMSYFYANMKMHDKNEVARRFMVNPDELSKYIKNLTLARNLCAHDERFYDFCYRESLATSFIPQFRVFGIPNSQGNYSYGTKDAFSIAVILALLLPKTDIKEFVSLMDKEFKYLDKELITISVDRIKLKMGFGADWKKLVQI